MDLRAHAAGPASPGPEPYGGGAAADRPPATRTAIGFVAHYLDATVTKRFRKLVREAPADCDVFLLVEKGVHVPNGLAERPHRFDFDLLKDMARSVIGDRVAPGNCHLRSIDFHRRFPGYRHYWFIEYDVVYTGDWRDFFADFEGETADLLGSHVRLAMREPDWYWAKSFSSGDEQLAPETGMFAFLPIHRISARGLDAVAEKVAAGWTGHFEMLIPTALAQSGLRVSDIGGSGGFTPRHRRNRHYLDYRKLHLQGIVATLRYGPPIAVPLIRNMIYHPCKTGPRRLRRSLFHPLRRRLWVRPTCMLFLAADTFRRATVSYLRAGRLAARKAVTPGERPRMPHGGHASPAEGPPGG